LFASKRVVLREYVDSTNAAAYSLLCLLALLGRELRKQQIDLDNGGVAAGSIAIAFEVAELIFVHGG
jgi:hypothetical protein